NEGASGDGVPSPICRGVSCSALRHSEALRLAPLRFPPRTNSAVGLTPLTAEGCAYAGCTAGRGLLRGLIVRERKRGRLPRDGLADLGCECPAPPNRPSCGTLKS